MRRPEKERGLRLTQRLCDEVGLCRNAKKILYMVTRRRGKNEGTVFSAHLMFGRVASSLLWTKFRPIANALVERGSVLQLSCDRFWSGLNCTLMLSLP